MKNTFYSELWIQRYDLRKIQILAGIFRKTENWVGPEPELRRTEATARQRRAEKV
jgi:hypothetical protein